MLRAHELPPVRRLRGARSVVAGLAEVLVACWIAGCAAEEDGSIDLFSERGADSGSDMLGVCSDDRDCPAGAPHCDRGDGECVECTNDDHCDGGECDERVHRCVECTESRDCDGNRPICSEGECVGCVEAADCEGPNQACDPESRTCIGACETDNDCDRPEQGICDASRGVCVGCLTGADCESSAPARICADGACVQCVVDTDCDDPEPYCDSSRGHCDQCLEDSHCPSDQTCRDGRCDR